MTESIACDNRRDEEKGLAGVYRADRTVSPGIM